MNRLWHVALGVRSDSMKLGSLMEIKFGWQAGPIVLLLCCVSFAQDAWLAKPYQQWTRDDIIKIISDSPWAQVKQAEKAATDRTQADSTPAVTIRLRSAMPIRQALVRLKQIEAKYAKMDEKHRAEFDAKMEGTLECPACTNNFVVSLGPPISRTMPLDNGVVSLRNFTLGMLAKRVYIANERGERRELVHFVAPIHDGDEAVFFFPRLDDQGRPLLTPENKRLIFYFESRNRPIGAGDAIPSRFEFNIGKLIINGKVEF